MTNRLNYDPISIKSAPNRLVNVLTITLKKIHLINLNAMLAVMMPSQTEPSFKVNFSRNDSLGENFDYGLSALLNSMKTEANPNDLSQHLLQAEVQLLNTQSSVEQVWCKRFGVSRSKLDKQRENLRKWISLTILKPLVAEVNSINDVLSKSGEKPC
jgi:hypothetical protein